VVILPGSIVLGGRESVPNEEFLLQAEGVDKRFPGVHALVNVDFDLRPGEVHVLLGENGAGKSTLMKVFSGTILKDSGRILIGGEEVEIENPHHARSLGIGMVYQELSLIPSLSIAENVFLGRFPKRDTGTINWKKLYGDTRLLFEDFDVSLRPRKRVSTLGMAERQLVEIAKALSMNVQILLLDEPTSALSDEERERLFDIIRRLQKRKVGIVYVSHRLDEVPQVGHRVTVLRDGKRQGTLQVEEADQKSLIQMMVGRTLKDQFPKTMAKPGKELLRVENLSVEGKLKGISFALHEAEIVCLSGLMGAGRTEFARALFGIEKIDSGRVYIEGREVTVSSPWEAIELGIGYLTENRRDGLVPRLPVSANITLASLAQIRKAGFLQQRAERRLAKEYIEHLSIHTAGLGQKVEYLSGGNQQKVALAKWMCSRSKIMIFDEPTRGIDVGAKTEVFKLMGELISRRVGIIMISSELLEVLAIADRILVMCRGAITAEFDRGAATQEDILRYAVIGGHDNGSKE
jgi:ribose transport system ATP-binding protein